MSALREKCPKTDFFWSLFSHIRIEYEDRIRNTDQKKTRIWTLFTQYMQTRYVYIYLSSVLQLNYCWMYQLLLFQTSWMLDVSVIGWVMITKFSAKIRSCLIPRNSDTQSVFTCSKLTIETLEQGVLYLQC